MSDKVSEDGTFSNDGFVRNKGEGRPPRVTRPKLSQMAEVSPGAEERIQLIEGNKRPGSFPIGPSPLKERKTKLACLGIPSSVLAAGSPEYARVVRLANQFKKARTREYFQAHGPVSSGVAALLAASALALSASRYLYEVAANTAVQPLHKGYIALPQMLKLASSLSDSARQNELSAWELAAREANIRKRNDDARSETPWITTPSGAEVKKGGRPRKTQVQLERGVSHAGNDGQTEESSGYSNEPQTGSDDA